jgi:hypothetical protein
LGSGQRSGSWARSATSAGLEPGEEFGHPHGLVHLDGERLDPAALDALGLEAQQFLERHRDRLGEFERALLVAIADLRRSPQGCR